MSGPTALLCGTKWVTLPPWDSVYFPVKWECHSACLMGFGHAQPWTNSSHYKCQHEAQSFSGPRDPSPSASSFLLELLPASRLSPFIGRKFRFRRKKKRLFCVTEAAKIGNYPNMDFSAHKTGKLLCVTVSHKKVSLTLEKESFKLCAMR